MKVDGGIGGRRPETEEADIYEMWATIAGVDYEVVRLKVELAICHGRRGWGILIVQQVWTTLCVPKQHPGDNNEWCCVIESIYVLVFLILAPRKVKLKIGGLLVLVLSIFAVVTLVSFLALLDHKRKIFCGVAASVFSIIIG